MTLPIFETLAFRVQKMVETVQHPHITSYTAKREETIKTCTLISSYPTLIQIRFLIKILIKLRTNLGTV